MNIATPDVIVFWRGLSPMIVRQVTLFPQPDSPTIASVRPLSTVNEIPSTAWTMPSSVLKDVFRSRTSSRAMRQKCNGRGARYASRIRGSTQA